MILLFNLVTLLKPFLFQANDKSAVMMGAGQKQVGELDVRNLCQLKTVLHDNIDVRGRFRRRM